MFRHYSRAFIQLEKSNLNVYVRLSPREGFLRLLLWKKGTSACREMGRLRACKIWRPSSLKKLLQLTALVWRLFLLAENITVQRMTIITSSLIDTLGNEKQIRARVEVVKTIKSTANLLPRKNCTKNWTIDTLQTLQP